jgi:signal transduction histidine kinase
LVNRTKDTLESVKKFVQLSRGRFRDKEFGDFFYRVVTEDIEKTDAVLTNIADYVKLGTPIRKMNTVHTFIEELLKKYKLQFEEKKIEVFKDFENDLPEVTVPDEHLRYILDNILQYTIASISPNSRIELLTQSLDLRSAAENDQTFPKPNGKYVEISVVFTGFEKPMGGVETPSSQKEIESDLELRLVDDLIKKNNGMMDFGADVNGVKTFISVKFPVERRNIIFYKAVNQ